jgi:hypothetical protein
MKNVITYTDGLAIGLAFCADNFFGYTDACLARRSCVDGFQSCVNGSEPSAP